MTALNPTQVDHTDRCWERMTQDERERRPLRLQHTRDSRPLGEHVPPCDCRCHALNVYRVTERVTVEYVTYVQAFTGAEAIAIAVDNGQVNADEIANMPNGKPVARIVDPAR
jgi:hypothetical protein